MKNSEMIEINKSSPPHGQWMRMRENWLIEKTVHIGVPVVLPAVHYSMSSGSRSIQRIMEASAH